MTEFRRVLFRSELPRSRPVPSQVIFSKDLVSLDAKDVKLGGEDIAPLETQDTSFLADSEISGSRGMYVTGSASFFKIR